MNGLRCEHLLGSLPCDNSAPHPGQGLGCTHTSSSYLDDRHTEGGHG